MKNNFNDCLARVLKDEGGYTNHPADPGGPTNFGITLTDYRLYIDPKGLASDVKKMSVEQAAVIYKAQYWDALHCDDLPPGVDYTCFDYGVNSGVGRSRKVLQRFKSLSGIQLIDAINNERMAFLRGLNTYSVFGKGWCRRVEGVREYSKVLANKKNVVAGPAAGGATVGLGAAIAQYFHHHQAAIIIGAIIAAIAVGTAIHIFKNKGKL
jgi:lysozyme family protein